MTFDNTNRGALFNNERKEQPTHPDMTGTLNVNGVDFWFSGWWKNGQKGDYLSLSLGKPKEARQPVPIKRGNRPSNAGYHGQGGILTQPAAKSGFDDMNDDIPF